MKLRIHRADGHVGAYRQEEHGPAAVLLRRLDPQRIFSSGPIVIGVLNPFSILNPDDICYLEIETDLPAKTLLPDHIDRVERLAGRKQYDDLLAARWPRWMSLAKNKEGDPFEALIEISLRSGESLFLHATGTVSRAHKLVEQLLLPPAIIATYPPNGTIYINPRCIVRSRMYHSRQKVDYPEGLWFAEADDI
jgi:hypothetical protein